ncbi:MAG: V-type ATP synthase subunit D [Verrucomicrobia bacterium]|nr:V-type ATP synthase subunit D [Verrucomicrobiota bacterium]
MAKIKHTKTELKAQRESLKRFQRFLPMLQLKKQQLQMEIQSITAQIEGVMERERGEEQALSRWVKLLSEPVDLDQLIVLDRIETTTGNIAGVTIPVLKKAVMRTDAVDLFTTPAWVDDAQVALGSLLKLRVERDILAEQRRRIAEELRVTSQRVNLFEKVKIPECKEHIRIIKIFLGDEQTAAVARGKIAKRRSETAEVQDAAA